MNALLKLLQSIKGQVSYNEITSNLWFLDISIFAFFEITSYMNQSYMVAFPRPYPTKPYGCIYGQYMKNMISTVNAGCQKKIVNTKQ